MILSIPPFINASSPLTRPLPAKAIFWPTIIGSGDDYGSDSSQFPPLQAIKARNTIDRPEPLAAFTKAVGEAQERVLILDDYLFEPENEGLRQSRVAEIKNWFTADFAASDVRLLTNAKGDEGLRDDIEKQFEELASAISRARAYPTRLDILVKFTLGRNFPYVHDRFAVIDNELWHFGATVGGFHRQVNAATRGWSAEEHRASEFFEMAWEGDRDLGRSHDKRRSAR